MSVSRAKWFSDHEKLEIPETPGKLQSIDVRGQADPELDVYEASSHSLFRGDAAIAAPVRPVIRRSGAASSGMR